MNAIERKIEGYHAGRLDGTLDRPRYEKAESTDPEYVEGYDEGYDLWSAHRTQGWGSDSPEGTVTSPGKFEGEPVYVPFYWEHDPDEDDGEVMVFLLDEEDYQRFPSLRGYRKLLLTESEQGFVYHDLIP